MRRTLLAALTAVSIFASTSQSVTYAATGGACATKENVRRANPVGGSAVVQICVAGRSESGVSGADVVDPAGVEDSNARIAVGRVFPVHTSIGSPAGTIIDVQSPEGVVARIYGGARLRLLAESDRAEAYRSERGRIGFDVPKNRLDFMNVVTESLLALVKGTTFDVDSDPGKTAAVMVDEGTVAVTHPVRVHLVAEKRDVDCVRLTEIIHGGQHFNVTYPDQEYRSFPNLQSARSYFDAQLDDAFVVKDPTLAQQALDNFSLLGGAGLATVSGLESPAPHKNDLPAKAGLAAAVGFAIGYLAAVNKNGPVQIPAPAPVVSRVPSPAPLPVSPAAPAPSPSPAGTSPSPSPGNSVPSSSPGSPSPSPSPSQPSPSPSPAQPSPSPTQPSPSPTQPSPSPSPAQPSPSPSPSPAQPSPSPAQPSPSPSPSPAQPSPSPTSVQPSPSASPCVVVGARRAVTGPSPCTSSVPSPIASLAPAPSPPPSPALVRPKVVPVPPKRPSAVPGRTAYVVTRDGMRLH